MNFNDLEGIKKEGFLGFKTVHYLRKNLQDIPNEKGVYMVIYNDLLKPNFLEKGTGGYFKGKNPNVSIPDLESNWVENAKVVYIGKAGGSGLKATLKSRINQYLKFGEGKDIGHYGGRLIWQIENNDDLLICWKIQDIEEPSVFESTLIEGFVNQYNKRPFANLRG